MKTTHIFTITFSHKQQNYRMSCFHFIISSYFPNPQARDVKVVRPIYGVELFDGETARFEVEISEDDIHGQWKLNGEVLSPSSVSITSVFSSMFFCTAAHRPKQASCSHVTGR